MSLQKKLINWQRICEHFNYKVQWKIAQPHVSQLASWWQMLLLETNPIERGKIDFFFFSPAIVHTEVHARAHTKFNMHICFQATLQMWHAHLWQTKVIKFAAEPKPTFDNIVYAFTGLNSIASSRNIEIIDNKFYEHVIKSGKSLKCFELLWLYVCHRALTSKLINMENWGARIGQY